MKDRSEVVERGSGNVFADIGVRDAVDAQMKADMALVIGSIIEDRKLTQAAAAELLGVAQPDVSNILRGRLGAFSIERLISLIGRIGFDVKITASPAPKKRVGQVRFVGPKLDRVRVKAKPRQSAAG